MPHGEARAPGGWRLAATASAAALLVRAWRRTVRLRFHGDETVRSWEAERRRFILALWHRHLLLIRYTYRGDKVKALVSRSRDGDLFARVYQHLGVGAVRGSSSRGGAMALRALIAAARQGFDLGITPDGPRGPLRVVQAGVVLVAAATGHPVVPVATAASRYHQLRSWDRARLPWPGSRVEVVYGAPIEVPRKARVEEWAPRIGAALNAVETRAEELAAGSGGSR
jgi:lysophospholipid acyltransferase (LPLAT)-like uncharacterized protein